MNTKGSIMRNAIIFLSVLVLVSNPISAETNQANCAVLSPTVSTSSTAFSGMYNALTAIDYGMAGREFSGIERAKFEDLNEINARLLPVFLEYVVALEELGLLLQRCSR
jgi:hypothetical protein